MIVSPAATIQDSPLKVQALQPKDRISHFSQKKAHSQLTQVCGRYQDEDEQVDDATSEFTYMNAVPPLIKHESKESSVGVTEMMGRQQHFAEDESCLRLSQMSRDKKFV